MTNDPSKACTDTTPNSSEPSSQSTDPTMEIIPAVCRADAEANANALKTLNGLANNPSSANRNCNAVASKCVTYRPSRKPQFLQPQCSTVVGEAVGRKTVGSKSFGSKSIEGSSLVGVRAVAMKSVGRRSTKAVHTNMDGSAVGSSHVGGRPADITSVGSKRTVESSTNIRGAGEASSIVGGRRVGSKSTGNRAVGNIIGRAAGGSRTLSSSLNVVVASGCIYVARRTSCSKSTGSRTVGVNTRSVSRTYAKPQDTSFPCNQCYFTALDRAALKEV